MRSQWHLQNFLRTKQFASVCDWFQYKLKQETFILSTENTIFTIKTNSRFWADFVLHLASAIFYSVKAISRAAPRAKCMNITCPQLSDCGCNVLHGKVL